MNIDKIREQVEKDTKLDDLQLDVEALRIPQLHGRYLSLLMDEKVVYKKLEKEYNEIAKFKWEYYTGKLDAAMLQKLGIDPFPLKILKTDLELYMNADKDLMEAKIKLDLQKIKLEYLEGVIKELNNRQWVIRSAIDWRKFTNGVG